MVENDGRSCSGASHQGGGRSGGDEDALLDFTASRVDSLDEDGEEDEAVLLALFDLDGALSGDGSSDGRGGEVFGAREENEREGESEGAGKKRSEGWGRRASSVAFLSAPQLRGGGVWHGGVREGGGGRGAGSRWEAEEPWGEESPLVEQQGEREEHGGAELGVVQGEHGGVEEGAQQQVEHGGRAQRRASLATGSP